MAGIGHNNGPSMERGQSWRKHCWTNARTALLPQLPLEVVRLRVKRAKALGLPYRTYAGIRASSGHDVVGFLFSSNGLGVLRADQKMSGAVAAKLNTLQACRRIGLEHPQITLTGLDDVMAVPAPHLPWSALRDRMKAIALQAGHAADRWLIIGDGPAEPSWAEAAQAAGYLRGPIYFETQTGR